jgi:hypothetical protein
VWWTIMNCLLELLPVGCYVFLNRCYLVINFMQFPAYLLAESGFILNYAYARPVSFPSAQRITSKSLCIRSTSH